MIADIVKDELRKNINLLNLSKKISSIYFNHFNNQKK